MKTPATSKLTISTIVLTGVLLIAGLATIPLAVHAQTDELNTALAGAQGTLSDTVGDTADGLVGMGGGPVAIFAGPDYDGDTHADVLLVQTTGPNANLNRCIPVQVDFIYNPPGYAPAVQADPEADPAASADSLQLMLYNLQGGNSMTCDTYDNDLSLRRISPDYAVRVVLGAHMTADQDASCQVSPRRSSPVMGPCEFVDLTLDHTGASPHPETTADGGKTQGITGESVRFEHWVREDGEYNNGHHVVIRQNLAIKGEQGSGSNTFQILPLPIDFGNIHLVSGTSTAAHDFDDDGFTDQKEVQSLSNFLNDRSWPTDYDGDGTPNGADDFPSDSSRDHAFQYELDVPSLSVGNGGSQIMDDLTGHTVIEWTATATAPSPYPIETFDLIAAHRDNNGNIDGRTAIAASLDPADVCDLSGGSYTCEYDWYSNAATLSGNYWLEVLAHDDAPAGKVQASETGRSPLYFGFSRLPVHDLTFEDANGFVDNANFFTGVVKVRFSANSLEAGNEVRVRISACSQAALAPVDVIATVATGMNEVLIDSSSLFTGMVSCGIGNSDPARNTGSMSVVITQDDGTIRTGGSGSKRFHNNELPTLDHDTTAQTDPGDVTVQGVGGGSAVQFVAYIVDHDGDLNKGGGCNSGGPKAFSVVVTQGAATIASGPLSKPTFVDCTPADSRLSIDPNSGVDSGDYSSGPVPWSAKVVIPPGEYTYHYEVVDSDGNRQDDKLATAENPAISIGGGALTVGPRTFPPPPTPQQLQEAAQELVDDVLGAIGCEGMEPDECATHLGEDKVTETFAAVEEAAHCDFAGQGNEPPNAGDETPCEQKPGAVLGALLEIVGDAAGDVLELATGAVQDAITTATGEGIPNVYAPLNCETVIDPSDPDFATQRCPDEDADQDGFTAEQEQGQSDANNPYSNPNDRDADLIPEPFEVFVDVNVYEIEWVNKDDAAACSSSECTGRLVMVPDLEKSVTVWEATGFTKDRRVGILLKVEETSDGIIKITTRGGGSSNMDNVFNGRIRELSWTVGPGFFDATLEDGKVFVRVMAEDHEPLLSLVIDPDQLTVPDGSLADLHVLGGPLADEINAQQADAGSVIDAPTWAHYPTGSRITVSSNPMNVKMDQPVLISEAYVDDGLSGVKSRPPAHCTAEDNDDTDGGSWILIENVGPMKYRVCGQAETDLDVPVYLGSYDLDVFPIVGIAPGDDDSLVPWVDQDGDGQYDDGEELGSLPPPPDPGDDVTNPLGCEDGEGSPLCVTFFLAKTLCGDRNMPIDECLDSVVGDPTGIPDEVVGTVLDAICEDGETPDECVARLGGPAGEIVGEIVGTLPCDPTTDTVEDCTGGVDTGPVEEALEGVTEAVLGALDCEEDEDIPECLESTITDVGGQAVEIADMVLGAVEEGLGMVLGILDGLGGTIDDLLNQPIDTDGDGTPDDAELQLGSNPANPNSTPDHPGGGFPGDWDADGWYDDAELQLGSDPLRECSTPEHPDGGIDPTAGC